MKITSKTKLTGIIGYPLKNTLSPIMQNAAFESCGLDWCYVPMSATPQDLETAIRGVQSLGFKGLNITMPYKEAVIGYLDEISSYAKMTGAVNTIHFEDNKIFGYNTDGRGFLHSLKINSNFEPENKSVVILGAGGAAHSIGFILAQNKVSSITIVNRTLDAANKLKQNIAKNFGDIKVEALSFNEDLPKIIDSTELIINTTPVSWEGGLVIEPDLFHSGHLVADIVYVPEETNLLKEAKSRGAKILSGKYMLLYQGAESFEVWTKMKAPVDDMAKALDRELSIDEEDKT